MMKIKIGLLIIALITSIIVPLTAQFGGGQGTEPDPWQIATADHIDNIRNQFLGDHFIQTADIDLINVANWDPIGDVNNPFTGYYDGDGYDIENLTIDTPNDSYKGLFGVVSRSLVANMPYIKNLRLTDVNIKGNQYVGGLVGYAGDGGTNPRALIDNVHVSGIIQGRNYVGGLIGKAVRCNIKESSADIEIICVPIRLGNPPYVSMKIGGLVGYSVSTVIEYCFSTGLIKPYDGIEPDEEVYTVGGLVGYNRSNDGIQGRIDNSYSNVNVTGNQYIGGLVGIHSNQHCFIEYTYSSGLVTGDDDTGGLVGQVNYHQHIPDPNINFSYWDMESSGQEESAGGEPLTTVKMMMYATHEQNENPYEDWDFDNTWAISEWYNVNPFPSYPFLQWQSDDDPPQPEEHNRPFNYDDFYDEQGRVIIVTGNPWRWLSFPWLSRDKLLGPVPKPEQTAEEALRPVANTDMLGPNIDEVWYLDVETEEVPELLKMEWDGVQEPWNPDDIITFCSTKGYKLHFPVQGTFYLPTYGTRIDPETEIIIYPWRIIDDPEPETIAIENWIGYYLTESQNALDAFELILDHVYSIQTEYGGIYWDGFEWWGDDQELDYGMMVEVMLREEEEEQIYLIWNAPRQGGRSSPERQIAPKPEPQYFSISYGPSYESIFISEIANDKDVIEVGVYADGECIGASVFQERYPLEILTYSNENHTGKPLTVVLYLGNDSYERYETVLVKDIETRQYSSITLLPLENKFSIIKLDRSGGERSLAVEEEEDFFEPSLGQNFPNPFNLGSLNQGNTNIFFSIPETLPVELNIYNIKGQLVRTLLSGEVVKGEYTVGWDGKDSNARAVSSGIYFYKLETADKTITRKMLIVR